MPRKASNMAEMAFALVPEGERAGPDEEVGDRLLTEMSERCVIDEK